MHDYSAANGSKDQARIKRPEVGKGGGNFTGVLGAKSQCIPSSKFDCSLRKIIKTLRDIFFRLLSVGRILRARTRRQGCTP
jgi:hypothetical protein